MLCLEGVHGIPTQWWFTCLDIEGGAKSGEADRVGVISIHAANSYHHSQTKRIDEFLVRKSSVVLTEETAAALRVEGVIVKVEHRDIGKPVLPSAPLRRCTHSPLRAASNEASAGAYLEHDHLVLAEALVTFAPRHG
ncbi:hypothetical protein [Streptosporangium sp. NPDC049644]|uniref:hypothetical protein n=1 Tax=Streptosporangium sp. NPDC049644 TaxID=3155507 RepID=UPI0034314AE4